MPSKETVLRDIETDTTARWDFAASLMDELKPWVREDAGALLDVQSGYGRLVALEGVLATAMYLRAAEAAKTPAAPAKTTPAASMAVVAKVSEAGKRMTKKQRAQMIVDAQDWQETPEDPEAIEKARAEAAKEDRPTNIPEGPLR